MESLFGRYKNALVLMLVLLAQVVLLAMQVRRPAPDMPDGHNVRLWRYVVTSVITPPERLAHSIGKSVRGVWSNYIYLRNLRDQNQGLRAENDRLRIEQASLVQDAREGQRLREMLEFRGRYIDKTIAAQVIGTSGTDQARVIYIDKGSKDGLQAQMPVITPDGIVGKLKNVFPHTSQVLLISDETSGTGVLLETTRVRGVMKGNVSGQPQMINISPDERIKSGEPVITSGGDQVYPPGMPIGVVDRVVADPDSSYVNVLIKPNANISAVEEVLVVTEFSDKMPFAQAKDMIQSEAVALAAKQRAADILSEKLPSLHDPNAPDTTLGDNQESSSAPTAGGGDPARPMRPPQPLRPDRYTPGAAPSADILTPGAAPPGIHRAQAVAGANSPTQATKSTTSNATATSAGTDAAPANRFPAKPNAVKPTVTAATVAASAAATPASVPSAVKLSPKPSTTPTTGITSGGVTSAQASPGGSASGQTRRPATTSVDQSQTIPAPATPPVRKAPAPVDSDSGGILTPEGMGSVGATPRPRATSDQSAPAQKQPSTPPKQPAPAPPGGA